METETISDLEVMTQQCGKEKKREIINGLPGKVSE